MALAIFSIEPELARQNYRRTVLEGVPLGDAVRFDSKAVSTAEAKKIVRVWGIELGELNLSRWQRLQPGDLVLFFDGKLFTSIARISRTVRNADLARSLLLVCQGPGLTAKHVRGQSSEDAFRQ